ncbi:AraC family ligand binding domain-containing protein [Sinorhizobium sp. RAC02]|uniref:AraC family ligand binding domain-containing protein n=1 Tax=Sinorhizobium sp. RAC02 TaxID=1842534 RepID=UPI00336BD132
MEEGCQAFSYDSRHRVDLSRGTVCLIAPGIVHEGWAGTEDGWTYRMFYPPASLIGQAAEDIFGTPDVTFPFPAVDDPELHVCLRRLHQMTTSPPPVFKTWSSKRSIWLPYEWQSSAMPAGVPRLTKNAIGRPFDRSATFLKIATPRPSA